MSQAANRLNFTRMRAVMQPVPAVVTDDRRMVAKVIADVSPSSELGRVRLTDQGYDFTVWGYTIMMGGVDSQTVTITLTCATPGVSIRYNAGFSAPTVQSWLYTAPIVLTEPGRYHFAARAFKLGLLPSPVLRIQYDLSA